MTHNNKSLLVVELNEFSINFLKKFYKKKNFKNIAKLINLKKFNYFTKDQIQGEDLDPWVQWVSVHTGVESKVHNIYRLGDIPSNKFSQFWETNFFQKYKIGLWGLMNASKNNAVACKFFVPDPWTFSEKCYPSELNSFLNISRYSSTNYLNISKFKIIKLSLSFLYLIFKKGMFFKFLYELSMSIIPHGIKYGFSNYLFISFYEYLGALLFIKYSKLYKCDISIIFLNLIAHAQHHYWDNSKNSDIKCLFITNYLDKILSILFDNFMDIIVHNGGISQINTNFEKPWICYRPIDQSNFLKSININLTKVMPLMTHDAHIFFKNNEELEKAYNILKNAKIGHVNLFKVKKYLNENKIFYTLDFFDEINLDTEFQIYNKKYIFLKYFNRIVKRTGRHINTGTIFSNLDIFTTKKFENHKFNNYIIKFFS